MVSADNLDFDVLSIVFSYLAAPNDFASIALVSKSFQNAVIPRLYRTLSFRVHHMKRYPSVLTPFAAVLARSALAVHVRHIDVRYIPVVKFRPHAPFIKDLSDCIDECHNLRTFCCTVDLLPSLLYSLHEKPLLHTLRMNGALTFEQADIATDITDLTNLAIERASWNLMDSLPRWAEKLGETLSTLTLYDCQELNRTVLQSTLKNLPNLRHLNIVGCKHIDHAAALEYVSEYSPSIESLAFTTMEKPHPLPPTISLPSLKSLTIDARYSVNGSPAPEILSSVIQLIHSGSPSVTSFTLKLSERSIMVGEPFIEELMDVFSSTLERLSFISCGVSNVSVSVIARRCKKLRRLEVSVPFRETLPFAHALSISKSIQVLVDASFTDAHILRRSLGKADVERIFQKVKSLTKVISDNRLWLARKSPDWYMSTERLPPSVGRYWFAQIEEAQY